MEILKEDIARIIGNTQLIAVLLLVMRIPAMILYFPCAFPGDTASSIEQFYGFSDTVLLAVNEGPGRFCNHMPFMNTLIYGTTMWIGKLIDNQNIAFFALAFIQTSFFALLTAKLISLTNNMKVRLLLLAFYALNPFYSLWSMTLVKDSIMSLVLLWITYLLVRETKGKGNAVTLMLALSLFMLSKNQCVYIVIGMAVVAAIRYYRKPWLRIMPYAMALVFYYVIWNSIVLPSFDVAPVGRQESMGFMFQQTALTTREYPDDITQEERKKINTILPYDSLAALYNPNLQDPVKFRFNKHASNDDIKSYIGVWISQGMRHPLLYLQSIINNCDGYFNPFGGERYRLGQGEILIEKERYPGLYDLHYVTSLPRTNFSFLQNNAVLAVVINVAWPCIVFIMLLAYSIKKRRYTFLYISFASILQCLIILLSPEDGCYRYVLPLMWLLPIYALLVTSNNITERKAITI